MDKISYLKSKELLKKYSDKYKTSLNEAQLDLFYELVSKVDALSKISNEIVQTTEKLFKEEFTYSLEKTLEDSLK